MTDNTHPTEPETGDGGGESSHNEFVLTDADGHTIEGERYHDPDKAIDARVRLMETHPDGDAVTVEPWGENFNEV